MLDILKLSSFDCNIHSKTNKVDCYKWAINLDKSLESYKPNILDEYSHLQEIHIEKEKQLKVFIIKNKEFKDFKVIKYNDKYYDYDAYNSYQLIIKYKIIKRKFKKSLEEKTLEVSKESSKELQKNLQNLQNLQKRKNLQKQKNLQKRKNLRKKNLQKRKIFRKKDSWILQVLLMMLIMFFRFRREKKLNPKRTINMKLIKQMVMEIVCIE